ncbi:predicted protein [Postia placenta Mad-698-R]|nr:predicted protein [Postia placenta Mad-698-R]
MDLLENLPRPIDDAEPGAYATRYTSDDENAYAHVAVHSEHEGLRLIFEWDDSDGWKYHNAAMMPFPSDSCLNVQQVLEGSGKHSQHLPTFNHGSGQLENFDEADNDDDYWNAYGSQDDRASFDDRRHTTGKDVDGATEDAYWARYSSVHGTADSTQPSPPPQPKRRLHSVYSPAGDGIHSPRPLPVPTRSYHGLEDALPILPSAIRQPDLHSKWDPASPRALAQRLANVSARPSPWPSRARTPDVVVEPLGSDNASSTVGGSEGSAASASLQGSQGTSDGQQLQQAAFRESELDLSDRGKEGMHEAIVSLQEGIQGIWKLWRASRPGSAGFSEVNDKDIFVEARTVARNNELETRVEELERELSVWKAALKTADEDKKTLSKTVVQLERSIGSLRDDNPLILCLIDGDGNIFSSELLSTGQAGGRQAAMLLTKGLTDHLASTDSLDAALPGRGQLWLTIYCNKSGLVETLTHNNVCTAEQFDAFCAGFNQASPLFSIVDVGNGKEAADAKIKECLRVFTRFPQTSKVFFGGAHDNGYTSTLTYLQNEGLLDKIILLRGYKDLAYEIKGLELPHLDIQGLFMTKRLQTHSSKKNNVPNQAAPPTPQHDTDKTRGKAPTPPSRNSASPVKKSKQVEPDQLRKTGLVHSSTELNYGIQPRVSLNMEFELPEVEEVSDYEEQCSLTRARNKTFLESLNLDAPAFVPKVAKKPRAPRKRKVSALHSPEPQRQSKVARVESSEDGSANTGLRRSGRNQGKKVDYASDNIGHAMPRLASVQAGLREMVTEPRSVNKRMHDPKTFSTIPGVPVGSWWLTREECSADAIHAPWVAGISGGPDGAYSIALSGGYEDDVDLGEAFTYTGAGGRDLKGTKTNPKNVGSRLIVIGS